MLRQVFVYFCLLFYCNEYYHYFYTYSLLSKVFHRKAIIHKTFLTFLTLLICLLNVDISKSRFLIKSFWRYDNEMRIAKMKLINPKLTIISHWSPTCFSLDICLSIIYHVLICLCLLQTISNTSQVWLTST